MRKLIFILILLLSPTCIFAKSYDITPYLQIEWEAICILYDCCGKEMPKVFLVDSLSCNTRGIYHPKYNQIKIKYGAPRRTMIHEFKHACGDLLGEKSLPEDCWGDRREQKK